MHIQKNNQINISYSSAAGKPSLLLRFFPTFFFYLSLIIIVLKASSKAKKKAYGYKAWTASSLEVLKKFEKVGGRVEVSGLEHIENVDGPVLIVGNHMSMMETVLLPGFVQPIKNVTFVVKESLLEYPIFKHVMRSREPIAVTRSNPRKDLKAVMEEGLARLDASVSIIIFPQTTRAQSFDPAQMSTIGIKLAKKAGVPIIPLALKTDSWQNGTWFKDFGRLDLRKTAYFSFGEPIRVSGKGSAEHDRINAFIRSELDRWKSLEKDAELPQTRA